MSVTNIYLKKCEEVIESVNLQSAAIQQAAEWFTKTILEGRMVHVFGSGHSRIMAEEMWPRYGSFPGFNPIVELSLTFHNLVVGANGQRQAMFLENVEGLADRILRNFSISKLDSALVISSSGCNVVPVEIAQIFQDKGIKVVALVSLAHLKGSESKKSDGTKLTDFANLVLDTGAPLGDASVDIPGLDTPVSPISTVGGTIIINSLKAEIASLLTEAGSPPKVLSSAAVVGSEKAVDLFESAYDEHAHRLAKLYMDVGK